MSELSSERLKQLIFKYLDECLTEAEDTELREYAALHPQVWHVIRRLQEDELLAGGIPPVGSDTQKILTEVRGPAGSKHMHWPPSPGKKRSGATAVPMIWKWVAVAVIVIVVLCAWILATGVIHGSHAPAPSRKQVAKTDTATVHPAKGSPGGYKATLILSDGRRAELNNNTIKFVPPGRRAPVQVGVDVLSYVFDGTNEVNETFESNSGYDTLETPRGGMFKVILPDGSEAFLNNESRLYYPTHFSSQRRGVVMSGEVRFDVVPDPSRPFVVRSPGGQVLEVVGTRFTITAYSSVSSRTILIEGKVQVEQGGRHQVLEEGQQLEISSIKGWKVKKVEDVGSADAWTRGLFYFRDMTLTEILQSLARWYDVDLDTSLLTTDPLRGAIKFSRNAELTDILPDLEDDKIHIHLKGNTIVASYR